LAQPFAEVTNTMYSDIYKAITLEYLKDGIVRYPTALFVDPTPTMTRKMDNLYKLETQAYLRIITGGKTIEAFDAFVTDWYKQGGQDITNEVNEAYR